MFGREIRKAEESGVDEERRRPEAVPLPPASWIALEPPIAAREPDGAREMVDMEVVLLEGREWLKELEGWRDGALDVRKPARRNAATEEEGREAVGRVVAWGFSRR